MTHCCSPCCQPTLQDHLLQDTCWKPHCDHLQQHTLLPALLLCVSCCQPCCRPTCCQTPAAGPLPAHLCDQLPASLPAAAHPAASPLRGSSCCGQTSCGSTWVRELLCTCVLQKTCYHPTTVCCLVASTRAVAPAGCQPCCAQPAVRPPAAGPLASSPLCVQLRQPSCLLIKSQETTIPHTTNFCSLTHLLGD
ncbi:KRTAP9-3 isoform 1 [Pongo abelii]|uniref:KRTAP9-3 isoform 1 n=1 Tax=Pongo abelii TaxID=9601 RepID=A0A2J8WAL0_PONAB|nr:KRTAP9-3 isoform 1 [Pongo abelii]